jgi:hypothetical protein
LTWGGRVLLAPDRVGEGEVAADAQQPVADAQGFFYADVLERPLGPEEVEARRRQPGFGHVTHQGLNFLWPFTALNFFSHPAPDGRLRLRCPILLGFENIDDHFHRYPAKA